MLIFIVEDDEWYQELLKYHLELNPDDEVKCFSAGSELIKNFKHKPDIVCLDYSLPEYTGDILLKKTKTELPETECIVISGQEDVGTAIGLLREGAFDYILKDNETKERLWSAVNKIRENKSLKKELKELRQKVSEKYTNPKSILGEHKSMQGVFKLVQKSLNSSINVCLTGETGTGKEVFAQHIHYSSERSKKPFVAVNVAAIPSELLESELFGHEKGAFTGASTTRIGKFEEANGGTIFLDEIGELDLPIQAKLLRVLQEREVTKVGGNKSKKLDIRVISATNKNLVEEVSARTFRQDLYFRLYGVEIHLPPLRERGNDIILIAEAIKDKFCEENNLERKSFSDSAKEKLKNHTFPGNVRELKAIVELACVLAENEQIIDEDLQIKTSLNLEFEIKSGELTLKEYTSKIVQHYLDNANGNVIKAAGKLGVGKSTIYRMINANEVKI
ncbi:MAG: sigma-54 dependent transcriptional regulator [Crocinitomicaceae bacterium]|nr:sigma-54 dependent transcriptional regulator [Crocinitomicaceae bacterium]